MFRLSKSALRLGLEIVQALALLPLYAKVLVAVGLAVWVVVVADWNEIFPAPPSPAAPAAKVEQRAPAAPAQAAIRPAEQKSEDRIPVQAPAGGLPGAFTINDPRVAPDGSIRNGEDGAPFFLKELKPFNSKDVCTRSDGERWACGLHAYATLRNSIAHKTIRCTNDGSKEEPRVSCRIGGENLALILVNNGLVELRDGVQDRDLLRAQSKAKAARTGIWNR
jgi:hypothetical protein